MTFKCEEFNGHRMNLLTSCRGANDRVIKKNFNSKVISSFMTRPECESEVIRKSSLLYWNSLLLYHVCHGSTWAREFLNLAALMNCANISSNGCSFVHQLYTHINQPTPPSLAQTSKQTNRKARRHILYHRLAFRHSYTNYLITSLSLPNIASLSGFKTIPSHTDSSMKMRDNRHNKHCYTLKNEK